MKDEQRIGDADTHELFLRILKNPEIVKLKIQDFVEAEREVFSESFDEVSDLSKYVISNWRSLAPPLVAFGLRVLLKQTAPAHSEENLKTSPAPLLN